MDLFISKLIVFPLYICCTDECKDGRPLQQQQSHVHNILWGVEAVIRTYLSEDMGDIYIRTTASTPHPLQVPSLRTSIFFCVTGVAPNDKTRYQPLHLQTSCTRLVVYVNDMFRWRPVVNRVTQELWGAANGGFYPVRTIVEVQRLNDDDIMEVEGTFWVG